MFKSLILFIFSLCFFLFHGSVLNSHKNIHKQLHNTSLHRQDVIWYWRRIAAHSPYKRHVLFWSKSISAVCLAPSVRAQQTRWIMQSWLWVTALKRTARHIGLWRTLGAQPGEWTGKYSLEYVCVYFTVMTCYSFQVSWTLFFFITSDIFWSSAAETCADWLRALPTLYL